MSDFEQKLKASGLYVDLVAKYESFLDLLAPLREAHHTMKTLESMSDLADSGYAAESSVFARQRYERERFMIVQATAELKAASDFFKSSVPYGQDKGHDSIIDSIEGICSGSLEPGHDSSGNKVSQKKW